MEREAGRGSLWTKEDGQVSSVVVVGVGGFQAPEGTPLHSRRSWLASMANDSSSRGQQFGSATPSVLIPHLVAKTLFWA